MTSSHAVKLATFMVAAVLIMSTGCGTALRVSHRPLASTDKPISIPGIPFYVKKARCRQEIVWFEPIYTLSLNALLPDKDGALQSHPRGTVVLSRTGFNSQDVNNFMKLLNNGPTDEGTVLRQWQKIVAHADSKVLARNFESLEADDRVLVGRSAAPVTFVDYREQYYINAKVPLAGSANVSAKVAEDGSLSEASGQVETKTLETALGALPISSVITGELGLAGKALAPTGEIEAFQLNISITGYRHTLAKFVELPNAPTPCVAANEIALNEASEYKREDISVTSGTDKGSKNDNASKKDSTGDDETKKTKEKKP